MLSKVVSLNQWLVYFQQLLVVTFWGFSHRSAHWVKNRVGLGGCARIYDTPSRPTRFSSSTVRSVVGWTMTKALFGHKNAVYSALVIVQPTYTKILSLAWPTHLQNGKRSVQTESVSTVYRKFGFSLQDRLGFSRIGLNDDQSLLNLSETHWLTLPLLHWWKVSDKFYCVPINRNWLWGTIVHAKSRMMYRRNVTWHWSRYAYQYRYYYPLKCLDLLCNVTSLQHFAEDSRLVSPWE